MGYSFGNEFLGKKLYRPNLVIVPIFSVPIVSQWCLLKTLPVDIVKGGELSLFELSILPLEIARAESH